MVGYFTVRSGPLYDRYLARKEMADKIDEAFNEVRREFGIKTSEYVQDNDRLAIVPRKEDEEIFRDKLKAYKGKLKVFKVKSDVHIRWINLCKERNLSVPIRMRLIDYFPVNRSAKSSIGPIDGVLFCYYETDGNFFAANNYKLPDGFEEIKASEYWKAIEDYYERSNEPMPKGV
ncbi:MAG: hypothetical protein K0R00_94 [Herbinix sp.]|jgi:hypothetical protein|nr:hypothetical protein [Herbinix sp.]